MFPKIDSYSTSVFLDLKFFSNQFGVDIGKVWNYENSIEQYQATGGTSKSSVLNQIEKLRSWLGKTAVKNFYQI